LNWTLRLSAYQDPPKPCPEVSVYSAAETALSRDVFDPDEGTMKTFQVYQRKDLRPGMMINGPAIISEDETTTVVTKGYVARINGLGYIVISKEST